MELRQLLLQRKLGTVRPQSRFKWTTFDVSDLLPGGWQEEVLAAAEHADFHYFPRTPVLSRESPEVQQVLRGRVHADQVRESLPWLHKLYRNEALELANEVSKEHASGAHDDRYGLVINVQRGTKMRFECHVDSNPLIGLLFFTSHASGGELVVGHDVDAQGTTEVEQDCVLIRPQAGHLVFFDAREHPHYARVLGDESEIRIAAVMNFYTPSCPETSRPRELNAHLYGDEA